MLKRICSKGRCLPTLEFSEAGLPWPPEVRESNAKLKNRSKLIND